MHLEAGRGYRQRVLSPLIRQALVGLQSELDARFGSRVRRVCLFGSWARGQASEDSDVDVAIVIDALTPEESRAVYSIAADVQQRVDLAFSPTVMSTERYEQTVRCGGIGREIERDGVSP